MIELECSIVLFYMNFGRKLSSIKSLSTVSEQCRSVYGIHLATIKCGVHLVTTKCGSVLEIFSSREAQTEAAASLYSSENNDHFRGL